MKDTLVRKYAEIAGTSIKDAKVAVDALIQATKEVLAKEGKVGVKGFGTMELVEVEEREARNPRTSESVVVPKHNKVKVTISKTLKDEFR